jgi:NADPH:quinone reductase-like Zn-dependent oxidoreductase
MRAYQLLEGGAGIDALVKVEGPDPKPAYRQVLVKVAACSLNFRDLGIVRGTYRMPVRDNIVPLSDGAGEVVEVGAGVTRVKVGDKSPAASSNAGQAATRPRMCRRTRSAGASTAC